MERNEVTVTLWRSYDLDDDKLPRNVNDLIAWLSKKRDLAPLEFRDAVTFNIEHDRGWGDEGCSGDLSVRYVRPETDEEYAKRIADAECDRQRYARQQEAKERALLNQLKAKYDPTP